MTYFESVYKSTEISFDFSVSNAFIEAVSSILLFVVLCSAP
ncbi:uncharacterized protein METZ01_LOCUS313580, partial [marine metagenome]